MHGFANPARFLKIARPVTGWLLAVGALLVLAGVGGGLFVTPPDYLQGETARILYIHVPAAWLGMAGWAAIAAASISQLVWRHPLAAVAGRARLRRGAYGLILAHGFRIPTMAGAFTVGSVVLTGRDEGYLTGRLLLHESRHATQYAWCLGLPLIPLYLLAAAATITGALLVNRIRGVA